ncbi:ABC transporter substrate-binding protein [Desulfobacterales bacterium HSG16]|nr:ABC transporter substrate-binding protein [Desulfobacterales bacterium HSG16]
MAAVIILIVLFVSCDPVENIDTEDRKSPGIFNDRIVLGSSMALKGHASYLGIQTWRGAMSYIEHVNEKGGIHGRKIEIIFYDDSYDPPKCLANTQKLIVEDNVFALFGYVGTPTTVKIIKMVDEARIPLLGMFTGANALRYPFNRYLINVRASYYQETRAAVLHLVKDLGLERIAVFYQYDAFGFDGLTGTELALKDFGMAPVARGSYVRGTHDVKEGLEKIIKSGAEAVVMIGTYEPCTRFIKLAGQKGFSPVFYNVSFVGASELARRIGRNDDSIVILSQVVPPPEGEKLAYLHGSIAEYSKLLKKWFPEDEPNFVGLEGYINARVLVEGLRRAGKNLTREGFIDAIESISNFSLGPKTVISFSPIDHQGMDSVFFTRLVNGRFILLQDWRIVKKAIINKDPHPKKGM